MTKAERLALLPGDRVMVRRDNGQEEERLVRYAPWRLGDGTPVIRLVGICGGYRLDRVTAIVSKRERSDE